MAANPSGNARTFSKKEHKKRPGIHAKNKSGRNKGSKNYLKRYRGQGR
jgi:hypothetical protein